MRNLCLFFFALLATVFMSLSPDRAQAQAADEPVQTENEIAVGDAAITDAEIAQRIEGLLDQIEGYAGVRVAVSSGIVTLSGEVLDNTRRAELSRIASRVSGVVAVENDTEVAGTLEERLAPAWQRIGERGKNLLANAPIFFVAVSAALLVSFLGWLLTTRISLWEWLAPNHFIADVYRALARILFVLLGIVLALDILNATALLGAVLGAAGVVGLAVGFAVRDTVENFIASILLSLRQPFRPNDVVEIEGDVGSVARLTSRATILISAEGNHIRIPNATVFKSRIVNFTRDPQRRFDFSLGVDADANLAGALATATEALNGLEFILADPPVSAWVKEVGDSNVVLTFTGWVDQRETDFMKARGEAIRTAKEALEGAGYGLPEPIYRVRVDRAGQAPQKTDAEPVVKREEPQALQPLPSSADPAQLGDAVQEAADRERAADDADENLLDSGRKTE